MQFYTLDHEKDEILIAVMNLPNQYKTLVYLYYYEGYASIEIAKLLKKPQSMVCTQLKKARQILKKYWRGKTMNEKIRNSWDKIRPSEIQKEKMWKQIVMQSLKKKSTQSLSLVLIGIIVLLASIELLDIYQHRGARNAGPVNLNVNADQIFINQVEIVNRACDFDGKAERLEINLPLNSLPSQPKLADVWSIAISAKDCLGCYNVLYQYNLFFEDKDKAQTIALMISDKAIPLVLHSISRRRRQKICDSRNSSNDSSKQSVLLFIF